MNIKEFLKHFGIEVHAPLLEQLEEFSHYEMLQLIALLNIDNNLKLKKIMATLDDLAAKVAQETTLEQSVETLLTGVNAELKAALANGDQTKIQAISDALDANISGLTASVTANTPAAPAAAAAPASGS